MQYTEPRILPDSTPNPNEGQNIKPHETDVEAGPSEAADDAGIDLDEEKKKIYPKTSPPEMFRLLCGG